MLLNKKGDIDTVKKLIIALIVIVVLFFVFNYLGDILYSTGNKAACQNWVYRNSVNIVKELTTLGDSPCITTEETIKTTNDNEIYEQLAKNMYECWDQYGQGEVDFYSNWFNDNTYCRICSEIKIDEKLKGKNLDIDKFEIYLSNHNPPNSKITYADFFTKTENAVVSLGSGQISLEPEKELYTSFVAYKTSPSPLTLLIPGGQVALAIIMTAGYENYLPSITIFKESSTRIENVCDYVYYEPEKKPLDLLKK